MFNRPFSKHIIILFAVPPKITLRVVVSPSKFWRDNKEYYGIFEKGLLPFKINYCYSPHFCIRCLSVCF